MKKLFKLFGMTALATVLAALVATPAFAAVDYEKTVTRYLSSTDGDGYAYIYVYGLTKSQTIKKSSVKVSNNKVVADTLGHYASVYKKLSKNGYTGKSYSAGIELTLKKAGTSTVSFKIGSKTYETKVTALKYVNPVKSLTITGVKSGKNLASGFKTSAYANGKAGNKKGKIAVTAASGWKVTSIYYSNNKTNQSWDHSLYAAKGTLNIPAKIGAGYVRVSLTNTKTGGSLDVSYSLG